MRTAFHERIAAIEQRLGIGLDLAIATLQDVAVAVVDTRAPTPSSIERHAATLRESSRELSDTIVATIARQAPVASDLRRMLVLMEIAHRCGLIANQFDLVSAQLMEIDPRVPDRLGTGRKLGDMAELAGSELASAGRALGRRDPELARRVVRADDAVNALNREIFATTLLGAEDLPAREVAMRHVLIARSLERVGDNAVGMAEQALLLATGWRPEPIASAA